MAFWGTSFIFDGHPCGDFDLMVYDVGNSTQGEPSFASTVSVEEETVPGKWKPYLHGVQFEKKLEFDMVFGVNEARIDAGRYLSRHEINEIAAWLTGHAEYKRLEIEQSDMIGIHYMCMVSSLQLVSYGNIPWALKVKFSCDGPYAYYDAENFVIESSGSAERTIDNYGGHNGYYEPIVDISFSGGSFSVTNENDGGRGIVFTGVPGSVTRITVDCRTGVITNNQDLNIYGCFNFKFLRLKRGPNTIRVTGNGTATIRCEFPANVGA